ncbi:macro domain-containing protein [Serratia plymuthica]|uniref:macro domain-containing protein n=1 Tax=Serratia plymuthica TaxID=82996 RepID=UPI001F52F060|nr:macro domain-containing protein [Serratia plymuthica]UNK25913.1 macro domain-containing protein [Serratia plymuthica]
MIRYESGDLLQSQTVALVNAVNCQGVMGKGIAYQFKETFPINYGIYREACKNGRFNIGDILIVSERQKLIVNFPTKDNWKKKSQYEFIAKGLASLKKEIIERNITSISIPPLGCGNGGLEWSRVELMLKDSFADLNAVDVVLFAPEIKGGALINGDAFHVKHLLVHYAFSHLKDKKRYSLNTLFYICQEVSGYNHFDFSIKHSRPYSLELEKVTKDIKLLKERYGADFDGFIEGFINTNLTKNMEIEFRGLIPALNLNIAFLNSLDSKEEFAVVPEILKKISRGDVIEDDLSSKEGVIRALIIRKMLDFGVIQKNIFNQFEIIN